MNLIPVNLITGFLGVGKTTAVRHLLSKHPSDEKWAVLVNEFGEVGVDGALLAEQGVLVQEVAGGCLCCVAAPAFTTGLNRVIRRHRPDRILIEPSGLGHPAQVLDTLTGPLYQQSLEVQASICLMDARHLASSRHRAHPNFQDQIHLADVLVANKTDLCTRDDTLAFERFAAQLRPAKKKVGYVEQGMIDPSWLHLGRSKGRQAAFPEAHAFLIENSLQTEPSPAVPNHDWLLIEGSGDGYQRAGWIIQQQGPWSSAGLAALIDALPMERKKGLFLTDHGWLVVNQSLWSPTGAPEDGRSRLELIHPEPLDAGMIDSQLKGLAGSVATQ